jgi:hypothetical protein
MAGLIRDPDDWARQWGWVSRRRAEHAAARLRELGRVIEETLGDEDDGAGPIWRAELEKVARYLAPPMPEGGFKRGSRARRS